MPPPLDPRVAVSNGGTRADGSKVSQTQLTGIHMTFITDRLEGFTSLVELRWKQRSAECQFHQFDELVLELVR